MPQVTRRSSGGTVLHVERRDSAGRTLKQIQDMEKNRPRFPDLRADDVEFASQISEQCASYPRVLYKLELTPIGKKPDGDEMFPDYPMPLGLAKINGFQGPPTYTEGTPAIIAKHSWITFLCGMDFEGNTLTADWMARGQSVDFARSKALEAKMLKEGWVDHPSKLEGLPEVTPASREY